MTAPTTAPTTTPTTTTTTTTTTAMTTPSRLLAAGPGLTEHRTAYGRVPGSTGLVDLLEAAGLTGRGGAGFPTHRKWRAVGAGGVVGGVVVANLAESEPASSKDRTLLTRSPHLVVDGLLLAAGALGARRTIAYVHAGPAASVLRTALVERPGTGIELVEARGTGAVSGTFLSGEESAVVRAVNGGAALPRDKTVPVFVSGVDKRPTLVQNAETLAHVALIARYGPEWFRAVGAPEQPGTMLCTVSGDVRAPDVIEVPVGTPLREVLDLAGGPAGPLRAVLVGGYHGAWVTDVGLPLSATGLAPAGAAPGAGVLLALGWHQCPLEVSSRVVGYLAEQSARQCGPCLNGLPALAASMRALATPGCSPAVGQRLAELAGLVAGRGACHHPDGTVRLVRSVLTTFGDEVAAHVAGRCGGHV